VQRTRWWSIARLLLVLVSQFGCAAAEEGVPEKNVVFYTTYGFRGDGDWQIPLKVWIYEEPDVVRRLAAKAVIGQLRDRAGIEELTTEQENRFNYRTNAFIADSESRELVLFRFDKDPDGTTFFVRNDDGQVGTDRNGLIEGTIAISDQKAQQLLAAQKSKNGWLTFRTMSEDQGGVGRVRLIGPTGISVISDVDDTIKITEISAGESAVLKNTLFEAFRAVPCMADMYSSMNPDTAFHYVSGGPWQMYQPLQGFLFSNLAGFPEGSFHMKNVRINPFESESYRDIWNLIASGSQQVTFEQKVEQISLLLRHFPLRQFILIGDSGEKDPEVFAEIRKDFANQLADIRIRDVVNAAVEEPERLEGMTVILPDADATGACQLH
jgi:hypothetical protein